MKNTYLLLLLILACNCNNSKQENPIKTEVSIQYETVVKPILNLEQANKLAELPLHCINVEFPNKLGQTLGSASDLKSPQTLHPAFYGCFDWHSAVHGHWSLLRLLKQFPNLDKAEEIQQMLLQNISAENILAEVAYFDDLHNKSFERTYSWVWLLKLAEELHSWDHPTARTLKINLQPLTDLMVAKYIEFLPKLNYPIRVGEHSNTAFGLSFAHDYAKTVGHKALLSMIEQRAKDFYNKDKNCPIIWEPSGFDFLSPCLEEAALMKRVLSTEAFRHWINEFMPELKEKTFALETGKVSDRSDGKLVHLDGVNFSRAWSLNEIANGLAEYSHLENIAIKHINYSLPSIFNDGYEGGHWLGSFAIYALNTIKID
ncbi:DUF2891 domain-containing protein [Paucihalobacter sp.]|uniref:DUF2891 domain-containing protein n=1 Tax=Paucihalobacter sp. TaxID=2850405 RepID=UPI002FDF0CD0